MPPPDHTIPAKSAKSLRATCFPQTFHLPLPRLPKVVVGFYSVAEVAYGFPLRGGGFAALRARGWWCRAGGMAPSWLLCLQFLCVRTVVLLRPRGAGGRRKRRRRAC